MIYKFFCQYLVMAHVVIRTSTVIGGPLARLAGGGEYR